MSKDLKQLVYTTKNHNGVFTNTLIIAEHFNRKHFRVVAIVDRLLKNGAINRSDIGVIKIADARNREQKVYEVNHKAFLVIVLSFTNSPAKT